MIKHIVCFKLSDNSEEMLNKTKDILLSMNGKVPMLRGIEVGVDFLHSPRSLKSICTRLQKARLQLIITYKQNPHTFVWGF